MGLAGLSFWHLLTLLVVVVLVFGTKKLGSIGSDLGAAIKGFRQAMSSDEEARPAALENQAQTPAPGPAPAADKTAAGSAPDSRA